MVVCVCGKLWSSIYTIRLMLHSTEVFSCILGELALLRQLKKRAGPVAVHLSLCLSVFPPSLYEMHPCCWNVCSFGCSVFFFL